MLSKQLVIGGLLVIGVQMRSWKARWVWEGATVQLRTKSYPFVAGAAFHIPLWLLSFSWHAIHTSLKKGRLCAGHIAILSGNLSAGTSKCSSTCKRPVQICIYSMSLEENRKKPTTHTSSENWLFPECQLSIHSKTRIGINCPSTRPLSKKELTLSDWRPCYSAGPRNGPHNVVHPGRTQSFWQHLDW